MSQLEFINIETKHDSVPIVLIDISASTSCSGMWKLADSSTQRRSVLDKELEITTQILKNRNITHCYLMLWNSSYNKPFDNEMIHVEQIKSIINGPAGCTNLEQPLRRIPEEWYKGKENIDMCDNFNIKF